MPAWNDEAGRARVGWGGRDLRDRRQLRWLGYFIFRNQLRPPVVVVDLPSMFFLPSTLPQFFPHESSRPALSSLPPHPHLLPPAIRFRQNLSQSHPKPTPLTRVHTTTPTAASCCLPPSLPTLPTLPAPRPRPRPLHTPQTAVLPASSMRLATLRSRN